MLPPGATWLIPVRFDDGDVPDWDLGAGRTLSDLNYADLFGDKYVSNLVSLIDTISKVVGESGAESATARPNTRENTAGRSPMLHQLIKTMSARAMRSAEEDKTYARDSQRVLDAMGERSAQSFGLDVQLSDKQKHMLKVIWEPMREHGRWPLWDYVQGEMPDPFEAEAILRSMPSIGSFEFGFLHYGIVWYDYRNLAPDSVVRLTVAAAMHISEYEFMGYLFVNALQKLVVRVKQRKASPFEVQRALITSAELAPMDQHFNRQFIQVFPELIHYEPLTLAASQSMGEFGWTMELTRTLLRYEGVGSVEDYIQRVVRLVGEINRDHESSLGSSAVSGDIEKSNTQNSISDSSFGNSVQAGSIGSVNFYGSPIVGRQQDRSVDDE